MYHIALYDKPTVVGISISLLLGIQQVFSFMPSDDEELLRICKNCTKVFSHGGRIRRSAVQSAKTSTMIAKAGIKLTPANNKFSEEVPYS